MKTTRRNNVWRTGLTGLLSVTFLCLAGEAWAQDVMRSPTESDGELAWKFRAGQAMHIDMTQEIEMIMSMGANEIEITSESVTEMTNTVRSVDDQGVAEVSSVINRLVVKSEAPGGVNLNFDSDSPDEAEGMAVGLAEMLKPLIGASIDQKISPDGSISDVNVPDDALSGFESADPLMSSMFNRGTLEDLVSQSAMEFPDPRPEVGYTWTTNKQVSMGSAVVAREITSEYLGVTDLDGKPVHRIRADLKISFPEGLNGVDVEIRDENAVIDIWFDGVAGQLVKTSLNQEVTMTFDAGGQKMTQKLEQSMVVDFRTED